LFQPNTLFVIGAGASYEVDMPIGRDLKIKIAELLDIRFGNVHQESGDFEIAEAIREYVAWKYGLSRVEDPYISQEVKPYLEGARRIRKAMPLAQSIDDYIHSEKEDEIVELCGKLAIVRAILAKEAESLLFVDLAKADPPIEFNLIQKSWLIPFWQMLVANSGPNDISQALSRVAMIVFNYDRCVEHFLYHALRAYYSAPRIKAAEHVLKMNIIHPYGMAGRLPWMDGSEGYAFGANPQPQHLLMFSREIRTFTERKHDQYTLQRLRHFTSVAQTVVFLGSAFHQQNLDLISPTSRDTVPRVFATAYGLSKNKQRDARSQIGDMFKMRLSERDEIMIEPLSCHEMLSDYGSRLICPD